MAAWADREVRHLVATRAPEVWVYGSYYRERVFPHLQRALTECGMRWRVLHESPGETLLAVPATACGP
jgi:hypothetical protein